MSSIHNINDVQQPESTIVVGPQDILLELCDSVTGVLTKACHKKIRHAQMIQSISNTSLKPDISGFVVFDGGFTGLVVLNFSTAAAMEIYQDYMLSMGMDEASLATLHTSDEVSDIIGELMNQIVGDFINTINMRLQSCVDQSQPKVLTSSRQLSISIDAGLESPVSKRVAFYTERNNNFYLEYSMDDTEFVATTEYARSAASDPDSVIDDHREQQGKKPEAPAIESSSDSDDLLSELGL